MLLCMAVNRDNCLIGMGAIILSGAVVEDNSIVSAGAIVTMGKTVPSGRSLWGRLQNLSEILPKRYGTYKI